MSEKRDRPGQVALRGVRATVMQGHVQKRTGVKLHGIEMAAVQGAFTVVDPNAIWTTEGFVDVKLLTLRGGLGWNEYRLKTDGKLVRRDASAKLRSMAVKARGSLGDK